MWLSFHPSACSHVHSLQPSNGLYQIQRVISQDSGPCFSFFQNTFFSFHYKCHCFYCFCLHGFESCLRLFALSPTKSSCAPIPAHCKVLHRAALRCKLSLLFNLLLSLLLQHLVLSSRFVWGKLQLFGKQQGI